MVHNMKLQAVPFEMIKAGQKTFELRLWDAKRQRIRVGDMIDFLSLKNKRDKIRVRVVGLQVFPSFAELYAAVPLLKCGYTAQDIGSADPSDMECYYSKAEQAKWGVVAIELEPVKGWRDSAIIKTSRYISFILRHKPEAAGIHLDQNGWANVAELIRGVSKTHPLDMALLEEIVATDDKQRYSFDESKTRIRANQGHSIPVDVELEELEPPEKLWHGTATKYVADIAQSGLLAKSRLYVHLSPDYDTAVKVGSRHGSPVVFAVNAKQMYHDGYRFYKSANNVWLTKYVPPFYLTSG